MLFFLFFICDENSMEEISQIDLETNSLSQEKIDENHQSND